MSGSFSLELEQYSYNDYPISLLVAFVETSWCDLMKAFSTCNDSLPRKQPLRWAAPQTSGLVPALGSTTQGSKMNLF